MTRRRPLPGFSVSTKGHSVLRKYAYGSPPTSRRYGSYGYEHTDVSPVRSRYNSREEDYITSAVQRATSIGSDALYDTLDTAHMSRNRDYDLLQHTNAAIVNTETHSSPKAAVASLRARSRPQTQPRSARNFSPRHQAYHEAAIVASKLEDEPGKRHRRTPRSKYAADKYRSTHKVGENPLYYSEPATAGLTASRGTVQRTTDRKAVRDAEGNFTKPRNILSWQRY